MTTSASRLVPPAEREALRRKSNEADGLVNEPLDVRFVAINKLDSIPNCIDLLCDHLQNGDGYRAFAAKHGVSVGSLFNWLDRSVERRTRACEAAQKRAAESYVERAVGVLTGAEHPDLSDARAIALAKHYQWMASKHNQARYGDKQVIESHIKTEHILPSRDHLMKIAQAVLAQNETKTIEGEVIVVDPDSNPDSVAQSEQ